MPTYRVGPSSIHSKATLGLGMRMRLPMRMQGILPRETAS